MTKKDVMLTIEKSIVERAKQLDLNLSQISEVAIRREITERVGLGVL